MVVVCPFSAPKTHQIVPIHEKILSDFGKRSDMVALEDGETGQKWKFAQIEQLAYSVAHALPKYGFHKGDVMGFYLENRAEFAPIFLGVSAVGGAMTGVNPLYTAEELGRQLMDSGSRYLLTRESFLPTVRKALPANHLKVIFVFDGKAESVDRRLVPMRDLFVFDNVRRFPNVRIDPHEDVVLLPYSSGTTGVPKGTILLMTSSAFWVDCLVGGKLLICNFDDRERMLAQKHRASYLLMVPTIMVFLAKHPAVQNFDLTSVKRVAVGAAPAGKELIETLVKRLPNLETVTQGYGMTESGGLLTVCPDIPLNKMPMGTVGIPIPGVELKIVSTENGLLRELGPMERGEIWAKSYGVMKGYINQPEITKQTIDKDGWLHTGDVGYFDYFGHFYVVDRLKELIKYKGYQGIAKSQQLADEIKSHVAEHAANYKQLRGGVIFLDTLPKGATGKMLRRELRNLKIDTHAKL